MKIFVYLSAVDHKFYLINSSIRISYASFKNTISYFTIRLIFNHRKEHHRILE